MNTVCAVKRMRFFTAFLMLFLLNLPVFSYDYFAEGERLFRENKPAEAIPLLYQASLATGTDPKVYMYLGLCYQQTGKYADAISIFMKGTSVAGTDRKLLFYNAGNVYYLQGMFSESEAMYSRAIVLDSAYAPAFLNRANARVQLQSFKGAITDYKNYLMLDPATWQKDSINQIIGLLSDDLKTREDAAVKAKAEKAAAEAEQKASAERYQRLLDEVSSSLQSVDGASTVSAGSEDVMNYDEEGQLE